MGVHGKGVSLAPFKALPFERVGWAAATQDVTLRRAAAGAGSQGVYADDVAAYIKHPMRCCIAVTSSGYVADTCDSASFTRDKNSPE